MELYRFLCGSERNYQYVGYSGRKAFIVDPLDGEKIQSFLKKEGLHLQAILITHPHLDHWAGIRTFEGSGVPAYLYSADSDKVPYAPLVQVREGDVISFAHLKIFVLHLPGHHPDHLGFLIGRYLFVGDTLFSLGCGNTRFGGNLEDLYLSIWGRLRWMDPSFYLLFGHDYALPNQRFAQGIEPENPEILEVPLSSSDEPPPLRTLGEELKVNPFLRCDEMSVITGVRRKKEDLSIGGEPREVFYALRRLRDEFRGN